MKKLFKILLLVAAVGVGICLVGASFGGKVDPRVWSWPGVLTLTLTFWGGGSCCHNASCRRHALMEHACRMCFGMGVQLFRSQGGFAVQRTT